jgi:glycosyltransferase involved in cell wall biosynthesis
VLHVITRLSLGGAAENTVASMVGLAAAGYGGPLAVGRAASDPESLEDAERRGVTLIDVPAFGREIGPRDALALVQLLALIRRERPAIVHTHTSKAGFLGRLAARLARVPAVIHQPHGHVFYGYYGRGLTMLYLTLERLAARWTDRIITLTERGTAEHLARRIGHAAQYRTVPSGVPTAELRFRAPNRAAARASLGVPANAFVIAGLGRLEPVKGFDVLIRALPAVVAAIPAAEVVLVGEGTERAALEAQAAALGIGDRVRVTGATADVARWLAASDVLAAPSRNEGMGRALVEAMALGIPVVAAAVGGIPAVVSDGQSGRLVPSEDADALAKAVIELGGDEALCAKLAAAAARHAEAFSIGAANAAMRAIYDDLVHEKRLG